MTDATQTHTYDVSGRVTSDDIPVLIGKGGHNMKTCIRNMYNKGCTSPNFSFNEDGTSISIKYETDEQLALMKVEIDEYISYYLANKDNFHPRSSGRGQQGRGRGQQGRGQGRGQGQGPRVKSFKNHLLLSLERKHVSSFIGEGGSNIKALLSRIDSELHLDNKVQLHLHYEEEVVYMTVTLFDKHSNMRTCLTVENVINDYVDKFLETYTEPEVTSSD